MIQNLKYFGFTGKLRAKSGIGSIITCGRFVSNIIRASVGIVLRSRMMKIMYICM